MPIEGFVEVEIIKFSEHLRTFELKILYKNNHNHREQKFRRSC